MVPGCLNSSRTSPAAGKPRPGTGGRSIRSARPPARCWPPLSTSILAELTLEAGIPPGVFNVVHGDGPTTGAAIAARPGIPKITFTGSTETGKAILRAAEHIKSVHLELCGKTPNIVFDDAGPVTTCS